MNTDDTVFTGVDLETTGLDTSSDLPVSTGIVSLLGDRRWVPDGFPMLVDPGIDVPADKAELHGITTSRVRAFGVPLAAAVGVANAALERACRSGCVLAAINARFDLTILDRASRRCGLPTLHQRAAERGFSVRVVDPLLLDAWGRGLAFRWRSGDVCDAYNVVNEGCHDAHTDAVAAAECARRVVSAMGRGGVPGWGASRSGEAGACDDLGALHRLQVRWCAERDRDRNPDVGPRGWPVAAPGLEPGPGPEPGFG